MERVRLLLDVVEVILLSGIIALLIRSMKKK